MKLAHETTLREKNTTKEVLYLFLGCLIYFSCGKKQLTFVRTVTVQYKHDLGLALGPLTGAGRQQRYPKLRIAEGSRAARFIVQIIFVSDVLEDTDA